MVAGPWSIRPTDNAFREKPKASLVTQAVLMSDMSTSEVRTTSAMTYMYEVYKPWVDEDRAHEVVEGAGKFTRSVAGAQNHFQKLVRIIKTS